MPANQPISQPIFNLSLSTYLHESVHDSPDNQTRHDGAEERESHNGPEIAEKMPSLHGEAGVENDGRQHHVEEQLGVKGRFLLIFAELILCHALVESLLFSRKG